MCIRDREYGLDKVILGSDLVKTLFDGKDADAIAKTVSINAVSYTHLRAHETVLDLVCRLLLEKKKNHESTRMIS